MNNQYSDINKRNKQYQPSILMIGGNDIDRIKSYLVDRFSISYNTNPMPNVLFNYILVSFLDLPLRTEYEQGLITQEDIFSYLSSILESTHGRFHTILVNIAERQNTVHGLNSLIDDFVATNENVLLVDMRSIATDQSDFISQDGRLLVNQCYYEVAHTIINLEPCIGTREDLYKFKRVDNPFERRVIKIKNALYFRTEYSEPNLNKQTDGIFFVCSKDVSIESKKNFGAYSVVAINRKLVKQILSDERVVLVVGKQHDTRWIESQGLVEFNHYIREQYVNRKMVLIYGNCHTEPIKQYLTGCKWFVDNYEVYPWDPIHVIKDESYFKDNILAFCDLFIHQAIQENNRYGKGFASDNIISRLRMNAEVIAIPNVYHLPLFLFPRCMWDSFKWPILGNTLFFRDVFYDEIFSKMNGDIDAIANCCEDTRGISIDEIERKYDQFKTKIKEREQQWDIKVADFIELNFRKKCLFYDPNHPSGVFLYWVARHLLHLISGPMRGGGVADKPCLDTYEMDQFQMPISADVKSFFNIEYETNTSIRQYTKNAFNHREINEREYIRQYLSLEWQNTDCNWKLRMKSLAFFAKNYGRQVLVYLLLYNLKRLTPGYIKKWVKRVHG